MFRPASRALLRSAQASLSPARTIGGRRFVNTEPPHLRSRSWKSSTARWGIAIAGIYYYNTSPVFAEQPQSNLLNPDLEALEDTTESSTFDPLTSSRGRKVEGNAAVLQSAVDSVSSENASTSVSANSIAHIDTPSAGSAADLEEEAEGEGAFNPETGEINWDCPCLGGMAHGPCGPEFREAFSCFVFSTDEPKGMDCIEKFQGMRDCFQQHPDIYKDELEDDEEMDAGLETERQELAREIAERKATQQEEAPQRRLLEEPAPAPASVPGKKAVKFKKEAPSPSESTKSATRQSTKQPQESPSAVDDAASSQAPLVPKAAHDAQNS